MRKAATTRWMAVAVTTVALGLSVTGCRSGEMTPDARPLPFASTARAYDKPGFVTFVGKGNKLWIFRAGSEAATAYPTKGPPKQSVARIGAGPHGLDVAAPDRETLAAYLDQ